MFESDVVCVDVETTGASPQHDYITEIGIVEIRRDGAVREWSTLVNPGGRIPSFIEQLTGITNEMVATAPTFAQLADELQQRLSGRIFVAHNARFDYGFIRSEFKRLNLPFHAETLCTVRLSRQLYPQYFKHNLDSLIERLGLEVTERHRALADARVLSVFLQRLPQEHSQNTLRDAITRAMTKPALPPLLDPDTVDDLPEAPGVYVFYSEDNTPLYLDKGSNLHSKVLSHFNAGQEKSRRFIPEIARIEWHETAGEIGTLLLETRLARELQPQYNRHPRQEEHDLCTWGWMPRQESERRLKLLRAAETDFNEIGDLYGLFASPRRAAEALRKLARAYQLCPRQLGLEAGGAGQACSALAAHDCRGVCVGKEHPFQHDIRLAEALSRLKLQSWPYPGPIGIKEIFGRREELHIFDRWAYLGTARDEVEAKQILADRACITFDADIYKLLTRYVKASDIHVVPLQRQG